MDFRVVRCFFLSINSKERIGMVILRKISITRYILTSSQKCCLKILVIWFWRTSLRQFFLFQWVCAPLSLKNDVFSSWCHSKFSIQHVSSFKHVMHTDFVPFLSQFSAEKAWLHLLFEKLRGLRTKKTLWAGCFWSHHTCHHQYHSDGILANM